MTAVKGYRPDHIAYLLRMAMLRLRADATAEIAEIADGDALTTLTASQFRLLDQLPTEGDRVTDVALRSKITKQALGQLASQLANRGYVDIVQDPTNRRAKVIRCTARGERARSAIRAAMAAVEARWRNEVGEERYRIFREVLDQLGHQIGELPAQPSPTASMTPPPNMHE